MRIKIASFLVVMTAIAIFASVVLLAPPAVAAPNKIAAALEKCRQFARLSPAQLRKIADANHLTVKTIQSDCYQLEHRDELAQDPKYIRSLCGRYLRMSASELARHARDGQTTPANIRNACRVIQNPSVGRRERNRSERSGGRGSGSLNSPPEEPNPCSCGATQACVRTGGGYSCRDTSSSDNQCHVSSDCGQNPVRGLSNCIDGKCT